MISTKGFPGTLDSIKTFSSAGSGQQTLGSGNNKEDKHLHGSYKNHSHNKYLHDHYKLSTVIIMSHDDHDHFQGPGRGHPWTGDRNRAEFPVSAWEVSFITIFPIIIIIYKSSPPPLSSWLAGIFPPRQNQRPMHCNDQSTNDQQQVN